jgi:hypothetical protein
MEARLSRSTLAPVAAVALASAAAAAAVGAWAAYSFMAADLRQITEQLHAAQARAAALEVLARNAQTGAPWEPPASTVVALEEPARPASSPQPVPPLQIGTEPSVRNQAVKRTLPATPAGSLAQGATSSMVPAAVGVQAGQVGVAGARASAPSSAADAITAALPATAPGDSRSAVPVAAMPASATTGVGAARSMPPPSKDRIELVPADRLGVARIEQGVVVMRSGKRVRVGETFESGEVLREVDPARGRIVTDHRNLVLL